MNGTTNIQTTAATGASESERQLGAVNGCIPLVELPQRAASGMPFGAGGVRPYYDASGIQIYHGDAREILPLLTGFNVVLTDPPYGVHLGAKANNQRFNRLEYSKIKDTPEEIIPLVNSVLWLCLSRGVRVVMTPGVRNMFAYPVPTHVGSFYYPSASGCNSWGFSCWQPIFYYGNDPFGGKGSRPDSFQSVEPADKNGHPCPKPIGQWTRLLDRVALPGEVVLDPFMGSGTTLRAAKDLERRAIGIEIEERYCEIAANRLAQECLSLGGGGAEHLETSPAEKEYNVEASEPPTSGVSRDSGTESANGGSLR